jgi:hypothetical protein
MNHVFAAFFRRSVPAQASHNASLPTVPVKSLSKVGGGLPFVGSGKQVPKSPF